MGYTCVNNYRLTLAFDGSAFCGWQVQKNGVSVCSVVQSTVQTILRHPTDITGCGRTDAGVHAKGYCANFKTEQTLDISRFLSSFNAIAPDSLRALAIEKVDEDFHARYSAKGKTYVYQICPFHCLPPILRGQAYHCPYPLDIQAMEQAAQVLCGEHDFAAFRAAGAKEGDSVRRLYGIEIVQNEYLLQIRMTGNGFLYKMARGLAGTILDVGKGLLTPAQVREILESKDRARAGMTLPPYGLFLEQVKYHDDPNT